jgi:hypothetical protein
VTATLESHRTADVARRLGVHPKTVWWWASRWYPNTGYAGRLLLTDADVMVLAAIFALTGRPIYGGSGTDRALIRTAETAIRADPRRWLLLTERQGSTFDDAETAAQAWWDLGGPRPGAWLIDLWPWEHE